MSYSAALLNETTSSNKWRFEAESDVEMN